MKLNLKENSERLVKMIYENKVKQSKTKINLGIEQNSRAMNSEVKLVNKLQKLKL